VNSTTHAIKTGLGRGWTEFVLSLKSPQDQGFYVLTSGGVLLYLFLNRTNEVEGTSLFYTTLALPSILGALLVFSLVIGPAYSLAMEREDGTLLRAKAVPRGLIGHFTGHILLNTLSLIPSFLIILIPGAFLFEDMMQNGLRGWVTVIWVVLLGLLATLPIGMVIGALVPGVQKVGTWGMLPILVLLGISGIFSPMDGLWDWVQTVSQIFPMYWVGIGMRSAFLPDAAAVLEIGESWRTLQTVAVLGAWAVAGALITPGVLRRMARRQSGSTVEAAKEQALQWVR
jgi:ABC-2 type transport system permease protein